MVKKLRIKESNNKTVYDDIVKKVLTPYLKPYAESAIKLFDSPFGVYDERRGLVTVGESMLDNIAYNYAKKNNYSPSVLNLIGNYFSTNDALVISIKDGRQRTYPKFENISRNLYASIKNELNRLSKELDKVIKDIANELITKFKGVTNESIKRGRCKIESISKPENKFINDWASSLSMSIPTDDRDVIKYQNKSSRKYAFNQLEHIVWRLPIYSSLMADIHERSVDISTTDDPYEFENYYYTLVMNKLLDMILNDMTPFKESPSATNNNRKSDRKMVIKLKENFAPNDGEITITNVNETKLIRFAIEAANSLLTDNMSTWHMKLGYDDANDYELVLGVGDENYICMKWAFIPKNSAMNEYGYDYMYPYDEKTGDDWDNEVFIAKYDENDVDYIDEPSLASDVRYLIKDFKKYVQEHNKNFANEACGKKMKKEAFDPDKLEKNCKD